EMREHPISVAPVVWRSGCKESLKTFDCSSGNPFFERKRPSTASRNLDMWSGCGMRQAQSGLRRDSAPLVHYFTDARSWHVQFECKPVDCQAERLHKILPEDSTRMHR